MPMNIEVLELFQNFDISFRKSNVLMILKVPDLLAFTNVQPCVHARTWNFPSPPKH